MKSLNPKAQPVDLRVRRTHKLLWEALMAEMSERAFEAITVSDICKRAMVHRTTFYKHYDDKYDLLQQGIRQMFDALVAEQPHMPPSAFSIEDPPPYFVRLFEQAAERQSFYRLMVCGEGVGPYQRLLKEYIAEVVTASIHELPAAQRHLAVPPAMHAHVVAGAALGLLAWWLENDLPFSPRQMAQYLLEPHGVLPAPA